MSILQARIKQVEQRLITHHVDEKFFPDRMRFAEENYTPVKPIETANRILVLLAASYAAYNFDDAEKVMDWLKKEKCWNAVTEKEKIFFRHPDPPEQERQDISWRFEAAYMLLWSMGKVNASPDPSGELSQIHVKEFMLAVPTIGTPTQEFLANAHHRTLAEIIDEKLFYESCMNRLNHQRDQHLENSTSIHARAAAERYVALTYVLGGNKMTWDELTLVDEEDEM